MKNVLAIGIAGTIGLFAALPAAAEEFNFTIVAGHPPITKGVSNIGEVFVPELAKRLEPLGHSINWTEAYAGSVADVNGVLEAVEAGIAEFGYVPHLFEGDKLPLEQITYVTPFGTDDLSLLMQVIDQLHEEIPAMGEAWVEHNQRLLAPVGIDTYQIVTDFPVTGVADLEGRKIGTAGLAVNWLKDTGAVPVAGALTDFYNSMSTGLIEGAITFEGAIAPYKFYEVAPTITKIGFGAQYSSALTVNLDTWNSLPEDVQQAMLEAAEIYREATAKAYVDAGEAAIATAVENGAEVAELSPEERAKYADSLPAIASDWAAELDARGLPGTETLHTYMRLSQEAGIEHARDWGNQ